MGEDIKITTIANIVAGLLASNNNIIRDRLNDISRRFGGSPEVLLAMELYDDIEAMVNKEMSEKIANELCKKMEVQIELIQSSMN